MGGAYSGSDDSAKCFTNCAIPEKKQATNNNPRPISQTTDLNQIHDNYTHQYMLGISSSQVGANRPTEALVQKASEGSK